MRFPATGTLPGMEPDHDRSPAQAEPLAPRLDLDGIERDLAGVEAALARLDDGTYWSDEVSGAPLPDELLAEHPTARRRPEA